MKLSEYAKQHGISYRTAFRWWKAGTIIVTDGEKSSVVPEKVAIYARVSSQEHKENLERQAERLKEYCAAKGYQVSSVVKEIASGSMRVAPNS